MKISGDFGTLHAMILLSCTGICLCFANRSSAEVNLPTEHPFSVESQAPQDSAQQSSSSPSTEIKAEEKSETNVETKDGKGKQKKKSDHAEYLLLKDCEKKSAKMSNKVIPNTRGPGRRCSS